MSRPCKSFWQNENPVKIHLYKSVLNRAILSPVEMKLNIHYPCGSRWHRIRHFMKKTYSYSNAGIWNFHLGFPSERTKRGFVTSKRGQQVKPKKGERIEKGRWIHKYSCVNFHVLENLLLVAQTFRQEIFLVLSICAFS